MIGNSETDNLQLLTEAVLRDVFSEQMINQAINSLNKGKVMWRVYYPGEEIFARWDGQPSTPTMRARAVRNDLQMLCTCGLADQEQGVCEHIMALLVAWAMDRESFRIVDKRASRRSSETLPVADDILDFSENMRIYGSEFDMPENNPTTPASLASEAFDAVQDYRILLSKLTVNQLRDLARLRKVPISGIRKEPVIESLAQALARPEKLLEDWPVLSPDARLLAGVLPFTEQVHDAKNLEKLTRPLGLREEAFTNALAELAGFGLVFYESGYWLYFPKMLAFWLPPDAEFVSLAALDPASLRVQSAPQPRAFYQTLLRLLIMLESDAELSRPAQDGKAGHPAKNVPFIEGWPISKQQLDRLAREARPQLAIQQQGVRIGPALSLLADDARQKLSISLQVSPEQIDFSLHLLADAGLVAVSKKKAVQPSREAAISLAQLDTSEAVKTLFAHYATLDHWNDLDLILSDPKKLEVTLHDYVRGNYPRYMESAALLRRNFLLLLRRVPSGQWYSLESLAGRAFRLPIKMMLQRLLNFGPVQVNGKKINLETKDDWEKVFAQYAEAVLAGPLYWQGVVDLAWEKDHLAGFRITPFGGALLEQHSDYAMPEPEVSGPALSFGANGSLRVELEAAPPHLLQLFLSLGDVEAIQQGKAFVRPTLLGAGKIFKAGWNIDQVLEILAATSGQPIPTALKESLQTWWQNFGSIQIYQDIAIIELGDDFALNELLAGTSLSRYLLYRFSSRLVAIRPEGVEALREELVKKGYTPKIAA